MVSPISKSRVYYTKSKQDNSPELLNLLFKHILQKNVAKMTKQCLNHFPMVFLWFSYGFPMIYQLRDFFTEILRIQHAGCHGSMISDAGAIHGQVTLPGKPGARVWGPREPSSYVCTSSTERGQSCREKFGIASMFVSQLIVGPQDSLITPSDRCTKFLRR